MKEEKSMIGERGSSIVANHLHKLHASIKFTSDEYHSSF